MGERPRFLIELGSDPQLARDLGAGGVLVPGCTIGINEDCTLIVRGAGTELEIPARVVYVDPQRGAGLELVGFNAAMKEQLARMVGAAPVAPPPAGPADELEDGPEEPDERDDTADDDKDPETRKRAATIHERLRNLPFAEQIKAAHSGDPQERMILERMYGKNVWEALLRNSRVTAPEVARIARMAALPKPLIEVIVGNGAWLQIAEVRRALLSNTRLGNDQIMRVLRVMSKPELKMTSVQRSYTPTVRDAAKRLIKEHIGDRPK